jgi:hypothetical protein
MKTIFGITHKEVNSVKVILTNKLTNLVAQISSDANSRLTCQWIFYPVWEPEVYYSVHDTPPLLLYVYSHFVKLYFYLTLASKTCLSKWFLFFEFSSYVHHVFLFSPSHVIAQALPIFVYLLSLYLTDSTNWSPACCSCLHPDVYSSDLGTTV